MQEQTPQNPETATDIRAKPFPFALYPTMMAHAVLIVSGIVFQIRSCVADDSVGGEKADDGRPTVNYIGTMDSHTDNFVAYSKIENFKGEHRSVWTAMQKETSPNAALRDVFVAFNAIVEKDEAKLLEITKKYTNVDFLPAYLVAKSAEAKEVVAYAKDNGPEQAISKLLREKKDKEDKTDVWPYRAALLKDVENKVKNRKKVAQEVWDSCAVSQDPDLYKNFPDTGPIAKRLLTRLEDPTTAGPPTVAKGLDGEPLLDAYGQICVMREAYAKELETANQCVYEKSKKELVPRYCYRSAYMQSVVRSSIKVPPLHKCDKDEEAGTLDRFFRGMAKIKSKVTGRGDDMAAPPAISIHQFAEAIDLDTPKSDLDGCLPPYWKELKGDPGHYDPSQVPKPKEGNCTTVELHGGEERNFCFYVEKDEEGAEDTSSELPPEGEYVRVPEGELTMDDLVPVKATKEITAMSVKIDRAESKHIDVQDILNGALILFRYQADGKETFCKIAAHNNHKGREVVKFISGKKSARTVFYNTGCSTYRRK